MVVDTNLQRRLHRRIDDLPVLPTVVGQLMTLDREAEGFFEEVQDLIEADPTFAARILAVANSAASAPRSPITSVQGALARLGAVGASNMILAAAVSRVFVPRDDFERSLWRHALQVAMAMRIVAIRSKGPLELDPDESYTIGLLHDIGRFVLFEEAPEQLRRIDEADWDEPDQLLELETSICGMTHGAIGKMASERWGLPSTIGEVILRHHETGVDPFAGDAEAQIATLHFVDLAMFPSAMPGTPGYDEASIDQIELELMPKKPRGLEMSAGALHKLIVGVTAEADDLCRSLGIG